MEFSGTLDKKNALGIWSKKFVNMKGLLFQVSDSQGGAPIWSSQLTLVTRGVETDVNAMTFVGEKQGDQIILRGSSSKESSYWFNVSYGALEAAGKVKPRNARLPAKDPRFDLPFVQIPDDFAPSFLNLEKAVLYWFGQIVKYGLPAKLPPFKASTEDRCVFVGDKCIYVTKPNSEVTRCMKIQQLTHICTSIGAGAPASGQDKDNFVVLKMAAPEYDLHISGADMSTLVVVISAVYKYLHKGTKELKVVSVKTPQDKEVALQLSRPSNFEMTLVKPVTKEQLKQALDAFAAKHQIVFEPAKNTYGGVLTQSAAAVIGTTNTAAKQAAATPASAQSAPASGGSPTSASAPATDAKKIPNTDALGVFLIKIGLEKHYFTLVNQSVDLEVLECMDSTDLQTFGIKDEKELTLIKDKLADSSLMDFVKDDVEAARKNANWNPKKVVEEPQAPAPAQAPVAEAPKPAPKPAINFFDDSDDDLLAIPTKSSKPAAGKDESVKMAINLDDSDDDLLLPAKPPAKPAAKKPIDLDDDDI